MVQNLTSKYTQQQRQNLYGDFKTNLQLHPGSKDVVVTTEIEAIKTSIINLLKTTPFERPFQPKLGSYLSKLLFENMDSHTLSFARQTIIDTVELYEPRALLNEVILSPSVDENGLLIKINFSVLNSNNPITIDFILNRVR